MTQLIAPSGLLPPHIALSCRIIRTDPAIRCYLRWLNQPNFNSPLPIKPDTRILESLQLLTDSGLSEWEQFSKKEINISTAWLASVITFAARQSRLPSLFEEYGLNLLAVSLLPLYRSSFAEEGPDLLANTRGKFKTFIIVLEVNNHLQLMDLDDIEEIKLLKPREMLSKSLAINLRELECSIDLLLPLFDERLNDFDSKISRVLAGSTREQNWGDSRSVESWDSDECLWQLACEMNRRGSELVIPRTWLMPSLDWKKIYEHWKKLKCMIAAIKCLSSDRSRPDVSAGSVNSNESNITALRQLDTHVSSVNGVFNRSGTQERKSARIELTKEEYGVADDCALHEACQTVDENDKSMMAEIIDLQDEAFINSIGGKIATCRSERQPFSLSLIELDNDPSDRTSGHKDSFQYWMNNLIRWMVDHGQWHDSISYVTAANQLVLFSFNCERQEMTAILRTGMNEISKSSQNIGRLKVENNCGYYIGIASTPGASVKLNADHLIASAKRCLDAAKKMGPEGIKSIEVF